MNIELTDSRKVTTLDKCSFDSTYQNLDKQKADTYMVRDAVEELPELGQGVLGQLLPLILPLQHPLHQSISQSIDKSFIKLIIELHNQLFNQLFNRAFN